MTATATPLVQETVRVDLGARGYDIIIGPGLMENLAALIQPALHRQHVFIVTDRTVADLYAPTLMQALEAADISCQLFILPAGESAKTLDSVAGLVGDLLEAGAERKDCLLALGGGIVGDMTGFAAAILRRGMDFIQIPTTLLAQVDSSVGGKTGVNTEYGKNLIGAFHQPRMVIADLDCLMSLPARERLAGYAEVVKYGLIDDSAFYDWLEDNAPAIIGGDRAALTKAVATSCRAKARIVAEDEREGGRRALLNLGHTFGHALEAAAGYDGRLLHGEAVALGMGLALDLAARLNMAPDSDAKRLRTHLRSVGMAASLNETGLTLHTDMLMTHMYQDKKVDRGQLVLIAGPIGGAQIIHDVPDADVRAVLDAALTGP